MEPDAPSPDDGHAPPSGAPADWRSLSHLRDRVEAAVREIERLRAENAALGKRVIELQDSRDGSPSFAFGEAGEDTAALKRKVQSFIDTIDDLLAENVDEDER